MIDQQLLNQNKDFFQGIEVEQDDDEMNGLDKEGKAIRKKRDKHLLQVDTTKRMYIE